MKYDPKKLKPLEKLLGTSFRKPQRLLHAMTHSSFYNELLSRNEPKIQPDDNERLEFFGDAVLTFIISKKLYTAFPEMHEGDLSKYRSLVVSRKTLCTIAKKLKLNHYLYLGKGEQNLRMADKTKILADTVEAIIGAIYFDRGMNAAESFVSHHFDPYLSRRALQRLDSTHNYKNKLQELVQKKFQALPKYRHTSNGAEFTATVIIKKKAYGIGCARSKREAEKKAAKETLRELRTSRKKAAKKRNVT